MVEFGTDWQLFDWWVQGMRILGYEHQLLNVNAAHVGDHRILPAPQWRDRLFFLFWRKGIAMPTLSARPLAPCGTCGVVRAYQWWKNPKAAIGKYRLQYVYRCPNRACRHAVLEPFVRPAADIIDFRTLGTRIGERARPLAPNTMRRIEAGLARFAGQHVMVTVNHGGHDGRHFLPWHQPFPVRSTKIGEGLLTPPLLGAPRTCASRATPATPAPAQPFIAELRNHGTARPVTVPLSTITSGGNHHGLVVPGHPVHAEASGPACPPTLRGAHLPRAPAP